MSIYSRVIKGEVLDDVLIIDAHAHFGLHRNFNVPDSFAEGLIEGMNALGTNMMFISSHSAIGPDYVYGNNLVIEAVTKYPDRFLGYAVINPNYPEDITRELDRCFKIEGMKGIKIHPGSHQYPITHKNYTAAYEYANSKKCPILIHVWGMQAVLSIGELAPKYSDAVILMGHSGADILSMEKAFEVVNNNENVYGDIALSRTYEGNIEWMVKGMGSKKLLYATDAPFFDPKPAFGRVALADISDSDKKDIFGLNIKRILSL